MRIGLSVHGTTFGMGIDALSGRPVISPRELMDKAINAGLEGVELPAFLMEDEDDPENPFHLTAGDVILVDEGTVSQVSTQSKARGELIATQ